MKLHRSAAWAVSAAGLCALGGVWLAAEPTPASDALPPALSGRSVAGNAVQARAVRQSLAKLPLHFEVNLGQAGGDVKFLSRSAGGALLLSPTEALLALPGRDSKQAGEAVRTRLVGANPAPKMAGEDPLPGKSNYFRGNDPSKWVRNVPHFAKVRMHDVYPGIDLVYYGRDGKLEYDFIVRPGADPGDIQLAFDSSAAAALNETGDLQFALAGREVNHRRPVAYQESHGSRQPVSARWTLSSRNTAEFDVSDFDPSLPLVIDPVLEYSSFLGGDGHEFAEGIHVDETGIYVGGYTASSDFPTTPSVFQEDLHGGSYGFDCFVTKLTPEGSSIIFSTYLGGTGDEIDGQMQVDASGHPFISGDTSSVDFPTTTNAFQRVNRGGYDAFVAKLSSDGSSLEYSTLLGGSGSDLGRDLAIDEAGFAYLSGSTHSANFPTTPGAMDTSFNGGGDMFVTKVSQDGQGLVFSTLIGGSAGDSNACIAVDSTRSIYVGGWTTSLNFPVTQGSFQTTFGGNSHSKPYGDGCVVKLDPTGSTLVYSTYFGGSGCDSVFGLAVDALGGVYVSAGTDSPDCEVTPGAFQRAYAGAGANDHPGDGLVAKLSPDGKALLSATYLGGSGRESYRSIAVDSAGSVFLAGWTHSADMPLASPIQQAYSGAGDWYVAVLNDNLSQLLFATYLGGNGFDTGGVMHLEQNGSLWVVGNSTEGWPTTSNAFQTVCWGDIWNPTGNQVDVGIVKIVFNRPPELSVGAPQVEIDEGLTAENTLIVTDPENDPLTLTASVGAVGQNGSGDWIWSFASVDGPAQSQTVTVTVQDGKGGTATAEFELTVSNVAPIVAPISAPSAPIPVGTTVSASATFSDAGTLDTHSATWNWGEGALRSGVVTEQDGSGTASGEHVYSAPGVYAVTLMVTDNDGGWASVEHRYVVVYDPDGGFVTGGGWINSPEGAYEPNPNLVGKATFGFNAKYRHGQNVPDGQTEFQFRVAELNFHSTSFEWLVVSGARAQFRGEGTINGQGSYRFMITAIDGERSGGGGYDKFRIRIWSETGLIYDNQKGTPDDGPLGDGTRLGGGSIVIHDD